MGIYDMGARSEAGTKYLLVVVDRASKFLFAYECFYDSPPSCQRRFQNRFRAFSPSFFFFLPIRPIHVDFIVNTSLSRFLFFNFAACSGNYSLFSGSCNRRFGGGPYRRNTLIYYQVLNKTAENVTKKLLKLLLTGFPSLYAVTQARSLAQKLFSTSVNCSV